jgi:hypothetical protein
MVSILSYSYIATPSTPHVKQTITSKFEFELGEWFLSKPVRRRIHHKNHESWRFSAEGQSLTQLRHIATQPTLWTKIGDGWFADLIMADFGWHKDSNLCAESPPSWMQYCSWDGYSRCCLIAAVIMPLLLQTIARRNTAFFSSRLSCTSKNAQNKVAKDSTACVFVRHWFLRIPLHACRTLWRSVMN